MDLIKYDDAKTITTLKQTVAQGTTDAEFLMFTQFCQATGLNPFKKEIWCIKAGGRLQLMTGINGFRSIANASEAYDGTELGLINKAGEYVSAAYPGDDFLGAWAKCHRKDRKIPAEGVAMLAEYDKKFGVWKQMRRVMIMKCAESIALRAAFPQQLNGLYTQEEMPPNHSEATLGEISECQEPESRTVKDPRAHRIITKCRFSGVAVGQIDAVDLHWINDVLAEDSKRERLHPLDLMALEMFRLNASAPVVSEAPLAETVKEQLGLVTNNNEDK